MGIISDRLVNNNFIGNTDVNKQSNVSKTGSSTEYTGSDSAPVNEEGFSQWILDTFGVSYTTAEGPDGTTYTYNGKTFDSLDDMVFNEDGGVLATVGGSREQQDELLRGMGFSDEQIQSMRDWAEGDGFTDFHTIMLSAYHNQEGHAGDRLSSEETTAVMNDVLDDALYAKGYDKNSVQQWREQGASNHDIYALANANVSSSTIDNWLNEGRDLNNLLGYLHQYVEVGGELNTAEDQQVFVNFASVMHLLDNDPVSSNNFNKNYMGSYTNQEQAVLALSKTTEPDELVRLMENQFFVEDGTEETSTQGTAVIFPFDNTHGITGTIVEMNSDSPDSSNPNPRQGHSTEESGTPKDGVGVQLQVSVDAKRIRRDDSLILSKAVSDPNFMLMLDQASS